MRGFERGADDFVAKPFSYGELRLRIAALLRRARERRADGRLRVGELSLDPAAREVRVRGARVELSAKEFALLRRLAAEPTRVYTKSELLKDVWGFRALGATRTLDSHACRLRRKLSRRRRPVRDQRVGRRLPADRRRGRRRRRRGDRGRAGGAGMTARCSPPPAGPRRSPRSPSPRPCAPRPRGASRSSPRRRTSCADRSARRCSASTASAATRPAPGASPRSSSSCAGRGSRSPTSTRRPAGAWRPTARRPSTSARCWPRRPTRGARWRARSRAS